ncbi:MAG: hypothetical protein QMD80_04525, partial [archaeon]|nr:hypothetical protein [archaeon]
YNRHINYPSHFLILIYYSYVVMKYYKRLSVISVDSRENKRLSDDGVSWEEVEGGEGRMKWVI